MLRPSKRQKFGGFKAPEEKKQEALKEVLFEEEQEEVADDEQVVKEPQTEESLDVPSLEPVAREAAPAARPTLASLLAEVEAAAVNEDVEASFEPFCVQRDTEGSQEQALLEKLREAMTDAFPSRQFELEPAGTFVTDLRLPSFGAKNIRSDFQVVLVFHDGGAEADEADGGVVESAISSLRALPGIVFKEAFRKTCIPAVLFETKDLAVELSLHNPSGVLNSWHLRDLGRSGWPGRLRALAQLAKLWALSKSIDSAKDGTLSPIGYELLVAAYLKDSGVVPALLPFVGTGEYISSEEALRYVLDACAAGGAQCDLWRPAHSTSPDVSEAATWHPTQLFLHWLDWMADTVLGFVESCKDVTGGCGKAPLDRRYIASVRDRTQEELCEDVAAAATAGEHWSPSDREAFLLIEEPLCGANVGGSCSFKGFCAIRAEVQRARQFFETASPTKAGLPNFQALLALSSLSKGQTQQPQQQLLQSLRPVGVIQQQKIWPKEAKVDDDDICWDFAKGNCKKGAYCKWKHVLDTAEDQGD